MTEPAASDAGASGTGGPAVGTDRAARIEIGPGGSAPSGAAPVDAAAAGAAPGGAASRARLTGRRAVLTTTLALGGLTALGPLAIDTYLPALPHIGADLRASAPAVQLSLTSVMIGLAAGQLVVGPISDRLGRRRPLLAGAIVFVLASLACAVAPSAGVLALLRFVQGLAASSGLVISRAIVRDLYDGPEAVRFFSRLMLVMGVAPVIAPLLGALVLQLTSWRGVFLTLAALGLAAVATAAAWVPETADPGRRTAGGVGSILRDMGRLLRQRDLVGYALVSGFSFAAMFAYISGSPFVLQNVYGASPQMFSLIFGINSAGLVLVSQINGWSAGRVSQKKMLAVGLGAALVGGVGVLAVVAAGVPQVWPLVLGLFLMVSSVGVIMPNATVLGLTRHPEAAGTASAMMGVIQFAIGAAAAPLVGLGGEDAALPMAVVILVLTVAAPASLLVAGWGSGRATGRGRGSAPPA